jgi:hypothetical protein
VEIHAIKTAVVQPNASLLDLLDAYLPKLTEQTIVAITSKIVSTCANRIVPKNATDQYTLIQQEADAYLAKEYAVYDKHLTIKQQRIVPSAGIDESNILDGYILYPEGSQHSAEMIWQALRVKHQLTHLGIIITDSTVTPLRTGVSGVCIGWCGFAPLHDYIGSLDIFNRPLRMTKINLLDALAASAVLVMGEGAEQTPLATIHHAPKIHFQTQVPTVEEKQSICIDPDQDLFAPLVKRERWIWK